ncbi:hypothetical protein AN958_10840 [Leucoagaricus sp. SymC.cos]|nr:hypothetical protein AN958_10840 [Leucoagaricus sp. SymC.cos]
MRVSNLSNHFVLVGPPQVVRNSKLSDTATAYFEVWDSQRGTHAANLVGHSLQFGHWTSRVMEASANPGASLCQRCWRWGHSSQTCHQKMPRCPLCSEPHYRDAHRAFAGCCKENARQGVPPTPTGQPCPHPPHCLNCHQAHTADSRQCPFWCHRFDKDWIRHKYQEVRRRSDARLSTFSQCSFSHV